MLKPLEKISQYLIVVAVSFSLGSFTHAYDQPNKPSLKVLKQSKHIVIKPVELTDSTGLVYLGGLVPKAELQRYLVQMKDSLGIEHEKFRQNQAARDHSLFHLTLVNPYEYQTIVTHDIDIKKPIKVMLQGLGKVSKDGKTTYFVVASSPDGQFLRQQLLLKEKDFHVTLGFSPSDIYDVRKGVDTLIVR
ncbi:hypothetical protein [Thalassotalea fusca]